MSENAAPDAAVRAAIAAIGLPADAIYFVRVVVAAVAGAGWLHDPAEVAALRAVVAEGRTLLTDTDRDPSGCVMVDDDSLDAFEATLCTLDAITSATERR